MADTNNQQSAHSGTTSNVSLSSLAELLAPIQAYLNTPSPPIPALPAPSSSSSPSSPPPPKKKKKKKKKKKAPKYPLRGCTTISAHQQAILLAEWRSSWDPTWPWATRATRRQEVARKVGVTTTIVAVKFSEFNRQKKLGNLV